jgi:glycosyltransferase involved in cell wall biosynthesis
VLAQSLPDWELILVDDGSRDGSLEVLKAYEKNDSRIKVIHQENAGPGLARNRGIKEASGVYIVFIDSDDVIKPEYFEASRFTG